LQVGLVQRFEHVHRGAREQRTHHLERRVLGGGADEHEQTRFHVRQEGVLLRLVEAVHFIDEHHRGPPAGRQRGLRALHRLADVLDPAQHRRDGDEGQPEGIGHQSGQRGLADTRRPPQDHRVRPARPEGRPQRLAGTEQVPLADHLVQAPRTQALGQRYDSRVGRRGQAGRGRG